MWIAILWCLFALELSRHPSLAPQSFVTGLAIRQSINDRLPLHSWRGPLPAGQDPWGEDWRWQYWYHSGKLRGWQGAAWYQQLHEGALRAPEDDRPWFADGLCRPVSGPRKDVWRDSFQIQVTISGGMLDVEAALYSSGPNRKDEGGAGDDVFLPPTPWDPVLGLAYLTELCLISAALLLWLVPWVRHLRSPRLPPEIAKALLIAAPPLVGVIALLVATTRMGLDLNDLLPASLYLPWQAAVGLTCGALLFSGALALRLTRPLRPQPPEVPMPEFTIDGARFDDLDGFYDEVSRVLIPGATWGRNLDAFNDILRGGFGTPDAFVLVWANSERSRATLGPAFGKLVAIVREHDDVELRLA